MNDPVRNAPVLTCDAALALVAAAMSHARDNGWSVACAVVDPSGQTLAAARMDGVGPAVLEFATDKAYTSALGRSTKGFFERMSSSADLTLGLENRPRLCAWEGGLPIRHAGALVGAIGVSGAAGPEDAACGRAALDRLGLGSGSENAPA